MPDPVASALVGACGALLVFALGRVLNWRRDKAETTRTEAETERAEVETAAAVARQWQEWSAEQGRRIDSLESRVAKLEGDLAESERKNRRYADIVAALVRWALALRDEVISLGGSVPDAPPEVEEALTTLEI